MKQRSNKKRSRSLAASVCLALLLLTGCGGGADSTLPPPASSAAPPASNTISPTEPEPEPPAQSPAASKPAPEPEPEPDPVGDAGVLDYELQEAKGVEAVRAGQRGMLGILKVTITNPTESPAQLHNTLSSLGGITTGNAANGLTVDKLFAAEPEARLAVCINFPDADPTIRSVVAAVDAAAPEIGAGATVTGYWYFFLTEDELRYKQLEWMKDPGDGYQILGSFPLAATP